MQGNGKGEETRNMLGYAKGTDARKYKGQGKARERQRQRPGKGKGKLKMVNLVNVHLHKVNACLTQQGN